MSELEFVPVGLYIYIDLTMFIRSIDPASVLPLFHVFRVSVVLQLVVRIVSDVHIYIYIYVHRFILLNYQNALAPSLILLFVLSLFPEIASPW